MTSKPFTHFAMETVTIEMRAPGSPAAPVKPVYVHVFGKRRFFGKHQRHEVPFGKRLHHVAFGGVVSVYLKKHGDTWCRCAACGTADAMNAVLRRSNLEELDESEAVGATHDAELQRVADAAAGTHHIMIALPEIRAM